MSHLVRKLGPDEEYINPRFNEKGVKRTAHHARKRGYKVLFGKTVSGHALHIATEGYQGCDNGVIQWDDSVLPTFSSICSACFTNLTSITNGEGPGSLWGRREYYIATVRCSQRVKKKKTERQCKNFSFDLNLPFCIYHRHVLIRIIHKYFPKDISKEVFKFLGKTDNVKL